MRKQPNSIFGIEPKITLANITLVANTFVWYAIILAFLQNTLTNSELLLWIWSLHFSGIIISALAGVFWVRKIDQTRFLKLWLIFGGISSLSLFAINSSSFLVIIGFLAFLLGVALGIGMPTCMKYYTDNIPLEKRGRISGFIMLAFAIGTAALSMVPFNALVIGVTLAVWRFSSLAVFSLDSSKKIEQKKNDSTYKHILGRQAFILYFIPWMVFSLVNYIGAPVQSTLFGEQVTEQFTLIQNGLMGVFAVAGGFLLDYIGRKRIAIAGFVMVGLGTAVLGIYPESEACWYFSAIVDGVGWGFLFVLFVLTIWGDLSYNSSSDKYYALGMLPFFASKFLERTLGKYISALVPDYALFSFTAFFLFLAVLPLVYAPETLPEKYIRERELKSYIEKAKREKEKYA
ncbi:MAG: MFS transporter [Candidatus Bathyarchaeota archaeon]|nr:MFS transporter [Candidatus Bathyarchaeota archaeon]